MFQMRIYINMSLISVYLFIYLFNLWMSEESEILGKRFSVTFYLFESYFSFMGMKSFYIYESNAAILFHCSL
jgi:hypothetical protein